MEVFICDDTKVLRRIFGASVPGSTDIQLLCDSGSHDQTMSDNDRGVVEAGTVDVGTVKVAKLLFDVLLNLVKM